VQEEEAAIRLEPSHAGKATSINSVLSNGGMGADIGTFPVGERRRHSSPPDSDSAPCVSAWPGRAGAGRRSSCAAPSAIQPTLTKCFASREPEPLRSSNKGHGNRRECPSDVLPVFTTADPL
jgi:hypothetical protein